MRQSEDVKEINTALAKAQGEYKKLEKSGYNKHLQYHYSTITDMVNATSEAFSSNGLSVNQPVTILPGEVRVETHLSHSSGQYKISDGMAYFLPANKILGIQELGSFITYLTKYDFGTFLRIKGDEDDDDGEGAKDKEPTNGKQEKNKPQTRKEEPKKTYTPPVTPPPAKTETPKETQKATKEEPKKEDSNIKERVQTLWNRTKVFKSVKEFEVIVKEKWGKEKLMELSDVQLTEWAGWVNELEIKKLAAEQKEKETATAPPAPPSTPAQTETPDSPWNMARPGQIDQIEKLLAELNWTKERKVEWWKKYRETHKIETSIFSELTNVQASSLLVYLENKLREKKLDDSLSSPPPPISNLTEEEAKKINEDNLKLAMEDKVPF